MRDDDVTDIVFDAVVTKVDGPHIVSVPTIDDWEAVIPGAPTQLTFEFDNTPKLTEGQEVTIAIMPAGDCIPDTPFNRRVDDVMMLGAGGIILGAIAWVYRKVTGK